MKVLIIDDDSEQRRKALRDAMHAAQHIKEHALHIVQHSNGAEPTEICAHHIPKGECAFHPGMQCKSSACNATPRKLRHC